jgi:hypothetical protein
MDLKFLNKIGITNRKEWKKWLLINHTDKNTEADLELCKKVISAGNNVFV